MMSSDGSIAANMPEPRLGIIIFARMSSSRLPGKMLRTLGPTTLLERIIERARLIGHEIILATSTEASDDILAQRTEKMGITVYRGSLDDVLGRAVAAAHHAELDAFCRLCGDRPFMPVTDMLRAMTAMRQSLDEGRPWDLITTRLPTPVPPGLLTEVVRTETLARMHQKTTPEQREHVTSMFYQHPADFRSHSLPTELSQAGAVHLSVDTKEDATLIGELIQQAPEIDLSEKAAASLYLQLRETSSRQF